MCLCRCNCEHTFSISVTTPCKSNNSWAVNYNNCEYSWLEVCVRVVHTNAIWIGFYINIVFLLSVSGYSGLSLSCVLYRPLADENYSKWTKRKRIKWLESCFLCAGFASYFVSVTWEVKFACWNCHYDVWVHNKFAANVGAINRVNIQLLQCSKIDPSVASLYKKCIFRLCSCVAPTLRLKTHAVDNWRRFLESKVGTNYWNVSCKIDYDFLLWLERVIVRGRFSEARNRQKQLWLVEVHCFPLACL